MSGLSADFETECRMLENNPAGLNRADIIVTANRGKGKSRLPLKIRW